MKKLILLFIVMLLGIQAKTQCVDILQANVSWSYHGMNQPNKLGNGWSLAPEIRYYFFAASGGGSTFAPCEGYLDYQNNFLIGGYIRPSWTNEWKRANTYSCPKIVQGDPRYASLHDFNFGLSTMFISSPNLFFIGEVGLNFTGSESKIGVRDSTPRYPYYKTIPIKFEIDYLDDNHYCLNKVVFSIKWENSFAGYQSIKHGNNYYLDTVGFKSLNLMSLYLEPNLFSILSNETLVDFSLIGNYSNYRGSNTFGYLPYESSSFKWGFGLALKHLGRLDEALKAQILFDKQGFFLGLQANLWPLYTMIVKP